MNNLVESPWWAMLLRGLVAIAFGILLFAWPELTLNAFIIIFGIFALAFGAFACISALMGIRKERGWGVQLFVGLIGIAAGIVALVYPDATAAIVLYLVAAWAIASGVLEIGAGLGVRTTGGLSWLLVIVGVISIAFGIIAFAWPGATILTILWLVGAYALASGVLLCIASFFVGRWQRQMADPEQPAV